MKVLAPVCRFPVAEEIDGKVEELGHMPIQAFMDTLVEGFGEHLRGLFLGSMYLDRFIQQTFGRLAGKATIQKASKLS